VAIKNRCVACDFVIEAPDAMRGREVVCPKCEVVNKLRAQEDVITAERDTRRRTEEERERFMRALSGSGGTPRPEGSSSPAAPTWSAPAEASPVHGLALLAGQRLKDISTYLLGLAYLILGLGLLAGLALGFGAEVSIAWRAVGFLSIASAALFVYALLKFLSDAVRALADLTDLGRSIDARLAALAEPEPAERAAVGGPG
jgi:phage FluMu protein Com